MKKELSPTPWYLWTGFGDVVARIDWEHGTVGQAQSIVDGEFIVKACNSYKQMRTVLENIAHSPASTPALHMRRLAIAALKDK